MALNYEQTKLIKATVPIIRQDGERISTLFYTNMIKDHPGMHAYFNPVTMRNGHQPKAFTMMMLAFASSINDIYELVPRMEKVAQKHASLAITPELYDIVGEYLLRAFGEVLGEHCWTRATREAWERAYAVMAGMLTRREALIYRDFGSWVGWRPFVVTKRWTELADGKLDGGGDTVTIEVQPADGKKLPRFRPGQYISLRLSAVPGREHPQLRQYYLCGDPRSTSTYRFSVRRDASRETENYSEVEQQQQQQRGLLKGSLAHSVLTASTTAIASSSPRGSKAASPTAGQWRAGSSASSTGSGGSSRPGSPSTAGSSVISATSNSAAHPRVRPGVVSSMLVDEVKEGDVLELTHPAGEFHLDSPTSDDPGNHAPPVVLISAGVGAAPLLAMLKALLPSASTSSTGKPRHPLQQNPHVLSSVPSRSSLATSFQSTATTSSSSTSTPSPPERPISWVHGSRHRPLYGDQVRDLAKQYPGRLSTAFFKTRLADSEVLSYTTDLATDLNMGRVKPVEDLFLTGREFGGMPPTEYYVCGPHKFLVEVKRHLEANRVEPARIKFGMLSIGAMDKRD